VSLTKAHQEMDLEQGINLCMRPGDVNKMGMIPLRTQRSVPRADLYGRIWGRCSMKRLWVIDGQGGGIGALIIRNRRNDLGNRWRFWLLASAGHPWGGKKWNL